MKTMTRDELKKRGLKKGDIIFIKHKHPRYTGWYLAISDKMTIGLNTDLEASIVDGTMFYPTYNTTKIAKTESFSQISFPYNISKFFRTFNGDLIKSITTQVIDKKTAKYVHAVHFGSSKLYTWRVPEKLEKVNFKPGDIVEVDTMHGKQYVQVKETAEYEYDEKTKEITGFIKAEELPF